MCTNVAYFQGCSRVFNMVGGIYLLRDIIEGKMMGKATRGRKRMELLHDMMEGKDYGQLRDLITDRSTWRQDSK